MVADLYGQVRKARCWALVLQRRFQANFYKSGTDAVQVELRKHINQLEGACAALHNEAARLDAACLATDEGKRLASGLARLQCETRHLAWYNEDYQHNHERVRVLQERADLLEARAATLDQRNEQLREERGRCEEQFLACTRDNLRLRDEKGALEEALTRSSGEVAQLRAELNKRTLCTARDQLSVPAQVRVLIGGGDEAAQRNALRVLRSHATRKPLDVAEEDGALAAVLQTMSEDPERAREAATILCAVAEADGLALFTRVPDVGRWLHELCRDSEVRAAALPLMARLLRLLTMRGAGGGALECKQERIEFLSALMKLWPAVGQQGAAMRDAVGAMANLTAIDPHLMGNRFVVTRLVAMLGAEEPPADVLVALRNLAGVAGLRAPILEHEEVLGGVVRCLRGSGADVRPVRVEAAKLIAALATPGAPRRQVLSALPFPSLNKMAASSAAEERDSAFHAVTVLIADEKFMRVVIRVDEFLNAVIGSIGESDVAFRLLAEMLTRDCDAGDGVAPSALAQRILELGSCAVIEVVSSSLYHEKRRLDAMKAVGVFVAALPDAASIFLPGVAACLRVAKTKEARDWAIRAVATMSTRGAEIKTVAAHPGILMGIISLMSAGHASAGALVIALTRDPQVARIVRDDVRSKGALLRMVAHPGSGAELRDSARATLHSVYRSI
jgi:hypothetical protein